MVIRVFENEHTHQVQDAQKLLPDMQLSKNRGRKQEESPEETDAGGRGDFWLVGQTGLEPVTSRLSSVRSNQLSYRPLLLAAPVFRRPVKRTSADALELVEASGFEPLTLCLQSRCSTN